MSNIADKTLDQFENLVISMLDSNEEQTVALLTAAFLDAITAMAERDGEDASAVMVVCDEYEVIIRKTSETPSVVH